MTTDIEEQLIAGMHQETAGVTLTSDVVGAARRRHQRRTVLLRATYAMGVLGLAGVTAAVLTVGGNGQPGPTAGPPPATSAAAPQLKLVAAVAASENISYRMRLATGDQSGRVGLTYEGAFDPGTRTGYVRSPQDDSVMTELLINGTRYIGGEPPLGELPPDKGPGEKYGRYGQYPGKHDRLSLYGDADTVLGAASPDPAALFAALKSANATISETPDGRLHFEYATQSRDGSTTTSGDVTRDAEGRIGKVALTGTWQSTAKGRLDTGTFTATLELFDYGVEVKVERPTDVVMAR
ncbi:hypothetical protein I0C86_12225 [Plantactinospora sp. S1510]|uniref:DUF2092 domain-containing protein n=1 Tax=Plantactinospora alkalitolerans TaxID=2789879 RepID=A0ABS0GU57_9ACTN|nr:hypothetical protein [Plantactinospora alkalitolerans]MBF9129718.1 hypothetical protein [Plantactinospora alkalitolerans]